MITTYHTRIKFRGLNFRVVISNQIRGSLVSWGVNFCGHILYFILKDTIEYYRVLCMCLHSLTHLSLISNFIHAIKDDASKQDLPRLHIIDLRLNTERNKLESVVNSDGKSTLLLQLCC